MDRLVIVPDVGVHSLPCAPQMWYYSSYYPLPCTYTIMNMYSLNNQIEKSILALVVDTARSLVYDATADSSDLLNFLTLETTAFTIFKFL